MSIGSIACNNMGYVLQIALATFLVASHVTAEYNVGVGIADMTGPAAEINMVLRDWRNSRDLFII